MEIKGTKTGILVNLEGQDWLEAKDELISQITTRQEFFQGAQMILDVGANVLRAKDLGELRDVLSAQDVTLTAILSHSIVTQETAQLLGLKSEPANPQGRPERKLKPLDTVLPGEAAVMIHRTMRSGFKVAYQGHVVVLGDVNPGAEIVASGSVVVWGRLLGTVHAGAEGDETAVICALDLSPLQLRIASKVAIAPKGDKDPRPEVASINGDQIVAETWQG